MAVGRDRNREEVQTRKMTAGQLARLRSQCVCNRDRPVWTRLMEPRVLAGRTKENVQTIED